jgi:hypothetical protein
MTDPTPTDWRALCAELLKAWEIELGDLHQTNRLCKRARTALAQPEPQGPTVVGPEWQPCVKLPITVHVREQRPGETHSSTREGITPLRPDDLIMRGVQGEEYPIGRELFNQTYRMGSALAQPEPQGAKPAPKYDRVPLIATEAQIRAAAQYLVKKQHCDGDLIPAIRYAVARWGRPAIEPVPVAERLPGPEDCDTKGRCWVWNAGSCNWWEWIDSGLISFSHDDYTHWLPHHALPVPQQEGHP